MIDDPERRTPLEILRTDSAAFLETIAARRNRPEQFFIYRPDHIDVCGVPIPVREPATADDTANTEADAG